MRHVVMYSSGIGSWATAQRVIERHPDEHVALVFADTNTEDADNYRFLTQSVAQLFGSALTKMNAWEYTVEGVEGVIRGWERGARSFHWVTNGGRTIWDVFRESRYLGNTRADICSRRLKREPLRRWLEDMWHPSDTVVHLGFGFEEGHRLKRAAPHWEPWRVAAVMAEEPLMTKDMVLKSARMSGLSPPRLYNVASGALPHANCGGLCIKAGQAQFRIALDHLPDLYAQWEEQEQKMREYLESDVSIMRDRGGTETTPLTMTEFRERLEQQPKLFDPLDTGDCSCFSPTPEENDRE